MPDSNELYCKIPENKKNDDSYSFLHIYVNFNNSNILIVGNSNCSCTLQVERKGDAYTVDIFDNQKTICTRNSL